MKRQKYDMTQNSTVTVSLSNDQDLELLLTQAGAGSYTITWLGVDKWFTPTGSAPVLKTAVGASDLIAFTRANGVVYGTHFSETGPAGAAGAAGPTGIAWKRLWTNATTYAINDAVYWNGSSYIALQPSSSTDIQQPDLAPTYWGPLASGGLVGSGGAEYVDSFSRANNANISTGAPFAYTALAGTGTEILSSMCHDSNTTDVEQHARAEQVLSLVDHHAQITLGLWTTSGTALVRAGVIARYDAAADNGYVATVEHEGVNDTVILFKMTAGVRASLAAGVALSPAPVAGDTLKLTVSGTSLVVYYNGVQKISVTDSTFTTGVRCGFIMKRQTSAVNVSLAELRFGV